MPYHYAWSKTIHKSKTIPTVNESQPARYRQFNASNVQTAADLTSDSVRIREGVSDIVYTTRPKGSSKIQSNYCVHTNTRRTYYGDVTQSQRINIIDGSHPGWYYQYWSGHLKSVANHLLAETAGKVALGGTLGPAFLFQNGQAYINDAAGRINYTDLTSVSIPNFLADIEDVKTLTKLWRKSVGLAKNVAGGFLNYKFGWKPTLGDLTDSFTGLSRLRDRIKLFKSLYGVFLHDRRVLLSATTVKSGSATAPDGSVYRWTAKLEQKVESFIYWTPGRIIALDTFDEEFRGVLDTLGFELNPRIVWDALPFTFVIDWFFNVGQQLERFKVDALELPIIYTDSFLQYKQKLTIESFTVLDLGSSVSSTTTWPGSVTTEDYFVRYPILPDASKFTDIGFRNPTKNQWTLLAALATVLAPSK